MPLSWKKSITCLKLTFQEIPHKEFGCPEGWFLRIWVSEVWLWSVCVSKWCPDTLLPPAKALIMTNNTICSSACKILWHLTRIVFDFFLLWEILAILSLPVSAELSLEPDSAVLFNIFFCLGQAFQAVSIVFWSAFSYIPKISLHLWVSATEGNIFHVFGIMRRLPYHSCHWEFTSDAKHVWFIASERLQWSIKIFRSYLTVHTNCIHFIV